jgi:hypothetical protein
MKGRRSVDGFPCQSLHFESIERPPELHGGVDGCETDRHGNLWISVHRPYYAAVGMYDGASWQTWQLKEPGLALRMIFFQDIPIRQSRQLLALTDDEWVPLAPFDAIVSLCNQQNRALWAGTLMNGLWRSQNGDSWAQIPQPTPSQDTYISALGCTADGTILAAEAGPALSGPQPIWRWDRDSWQPLEPPQHRNFRRIMKIVVPANGHIWAVSFYGGLWEWNKGTWIQANQAGPKSNRIPSQGLHDMCFDDSQNRAFVMSAKYGLVTRQAGPWLRITSDTDSSFLGDDLHGRMHIGAGKLWIAASTTTIYWISLDQFGQP